MANDQPTLSPQLEGKFELRGYVPGPMGLKDGSLINWCHATLKQAERIYELGLAKKYLFKVEPKSYKKKSVDPPPTVETAE